MLRKKKSLAFVLALVMMLTLIPASAFAATSNTTTSGVPTVAPDAKIPTSTITIKVGDGGFTTTEQSINLSLKNAEWTMDPVGAGIVTSGGALSDDATGPSIKVIGEGNSTSSTKSAIVDIDAYSVSNTTARVTFETAGLAEEDDVFTITLSLTSGSDSGEVTVNIDPIDGQFSSSKHTVALVGTGKTTATVPGTVGSTWRTAAYKAAQIEINENAVNAVDSASPQAIELTLPSGMEWKTGTVVGGNMGTAAAIATSNIDGRTLKFTINPIPNSSVRQVLSILPEISVTRDAKLGDITVTIRNQSDSGVTKSITNASGLVIGKFIEESVSVTTVKEADIPEFVAGAVDTDYEIEITVEEVIASALAAGRFIDFEMPANVQITSDGAVEVEGTTISDHDWYNEKGKLKEDTSTFEYTLSKDLKSSVKEKLKFTIPVTVEANAKAGDLEVTVKGGKAGLPDTKLVVAKIVEPIKAGITVSALRAGVQNQALSDITITENFPGAFKRDKNNDKLVLTIPDINGTFKDSKVEVVSGDLEIGKVELNTVNSNPTMTIEIKSESVSKASEIKITNSKLSVDRTPAEGKYSMKIGGNSLVQNGLYNDGDFSDSVITTDYLNIVTPADSGVNATFKIGESAYISNGISHTMDAAAYIDSANRTMVPIRYVANAMGVSTDQVIWNQATQTATIFGKNIVSIKVGSNVITSNGTPITMDTVAVNNAGRVYVPLRYVANALSADVAWDQTTQTATIFTVK